MNQPPTIHLKDYTPPAFLVDQAELTFVLGEEHTEVNATLHMRRNPQTQDITTPLTLDGQNLDLRSININGRTLEMIDYQYADEKLTIQEIPDAFTLNTTVRIKPQENTQLEGLYQSSGNFCTQCEAEGFRRITFFPDRPDILTRFTTTIIGDKKKYPVLLSNGNPTEQGLLDEGKHFATWNDPYPKPCYLFALVAGDLACVQDAFTTRSGRNVAIRFYVEHGHEKMCAHAVDSLKRAMQWDEETFGLEYDLDIYQVVAVSDFNMGAMENKGLNVFNAKYVLADPETASDADFEGVEGVIAHEYFHNWTGNRITCRDWFQLSLKEGLTVFRDQRFSKEMNSEGVKRIQDVKVLRAFQFPEDASPLAHPVRPESYVEINNFYTVTVYEKGSEVVGLYATLLGTEGFRRGMDLYVERHDGQAVTVEDFFNAMSDANPGKLSWPLFRNWYAQAGTPHVDLTLTHNPNDETLDLLIRQSCDPSPGQPEKKPCLIPLTMALLDENGREINLHLDGENQPRGKETTLHVTESEQRFRFLNVPQKHYPSMLRRFSAPVILRMQETREALAFLAAHDGDLFNRWEAGQKLATSILLENVSQIQAGAPPLDGNNPLPGIFSAILADDRLTPAEKTLCMTLPGEGVLHEQMRIADPDAIHTARNALRKALATHLKTELLAVYRELAAETGPFEITPDAIGRRSLKNLAIATLMANPDDDATALLLNQFRSAASMTDALGALTPLAHSTRPEKTAALAEFYAKWKQNPLVMDKWLTLQAQDPSPGAIARVTELLEHPAFSIKNPNKVRSLIGAFSRGNPVHFHDPSGTGYAFLGDAVAKLNPLNPQVASRLLQEFARWEKYDDNRQTLMRRQLERILDLPGLAKDLFEVASKTLSKTGNTV